MSCCGRARQNLHHTPVTSSSTHHAIVYFTYHGPTALRVRGPVSGRLYAFTGPGMRLKVDARDQRGLLGVPNLRLS